MCFAGALNLCDSFVLQIIRKKIIRNLFPCKVSNIDHCLFSGDGRHFLKHRILYVRFVYALYLSIIDKL